MISRLRHTHTSLHIDNNFGVRIMRPTCSFVTTASCLLLASPNSVRAFQAGGFFAPVAKQQLQQHHQHATPARFIPRRLPVGSMSMSQDNFDKTSPARQHQRPQLAAAAAAANRVLPVTSLSATASASVDVSVGDGSFELAVSAGTEKKSKLFKAYEKGAEYFTNLFPVWLTLFSLVALKDPNMFAWFTTE